MQKSAKNGLRLFFSIKNEGKEYMMCLGFLKYMWSMIRSKLMTCKGIYFVPQCHNLGPFFAHAQKEASALVSFEMVHPTSYSGKNRCTCYYNYEIHFFLNTLKSLSKPSFQCDTNFLEFDFADFLFILMCMTHFNTRKMSCTYGTSGN